jgi:hypothetical protein
MASLRFPKNNTCLFKNLIKFHFLKYLRVNHHFILEKKSRKRAMPVTSRIPEKPLFQL